MKTYQKIILIFALICIFISACITFIPIDKYQNAYFEFIKYYRNKPQEHFNKQIEYAEYIEEHDKLPPEIFERKNHNPPHKIVKKQRPEKRKAKYIRDKNNPNILYPYKERKFLFFRIYYK